MREIKFKGWDELTEKMLNWYQLLDMNLKNIFISEKSTAIHLMQYTGLHDKNGKEIYEGDIVKIHSHNYEYGYKEEEIGEIKFIEGSFGFYREKCKNQYYFNSLSDEDSYGELDYYEVIGNVWEDGDLLDDIKNTKTN